MQYLHLFHNDNGLVGFDGGAKHLTPLFETAGFVDIEVIKGSFDNGDWRKGFQHSS